MHQLLDAFHVTAHAMASTTADAAQALDPISQMPTNDVSTAGEGVVSVHPSVAIGVAGLLMNAYNFMPIGRLDGGRVSASIFGRKTASQLSGATVAGLFFSFFNNQPASLFLWSLIVLFLQRGQDIPPEDDCTPVATMGEATTKPIQWFGRAGAFFFCVALTAGMLLPASTGVSPDTVTTVSQGIGSTDSTVIINQLNSLRQGLDI